MLGVEWVLGLFFIIMGLSLLLDPHRWIAFAGKMYGQIEWMMLMGFITLVLGLVMLILHPLWDMTFSVVTTVAAWLTCVKGFMLLCFPNVVKSIFPLRIFNPTLLKIEALLMIVLGAFIAYFSGVTVI